jgi:hypothetical protein
MLYTRFIQLQVKKSKYDSNSRANKEQVVTK